MAATIRNKNLFCTNCGGEFVLKYPIGISEMAAKMDSFVALHKDCEKTWEEPKVESGKTISERAVWWISDGERGASSEARWCCLMGRGVKRTNHPCDPDDFKRCYKLLQLIPEWKDELHKLKPLSPVWSLLVDNWNKLTEMFEENEKSGWKNYKEIGMYEFMKKIGC